MPRIRQPILILGRGRCGTSALAGALVKGGWRFPGHRPPKRIACMSAGEGVCGYLETKGEIRTKGNHKRTGLPIRTRGDETIILMTRDEDSQSKSIAVQLKGDGDIEKARRSIIKFNKEARKLKPIEIPFEDLINKPHEVLAMFDIKRLDEAIEFIKPRYKHF